MPTALYQGYDSFLGQARDAALSGTTTPPTGAESYERVHICTDPESVMRAITIAAPGSLDGSFDAKMAWAQSLSLTRTSVVLVLHKVMIDGKVQAESYAYGGEPIADVQSFFREHGDSFVSEIVFGTEHVEAFVSNTESPMQFFQQDFCGVLSFTTTGYERVPGITGFEPVAANRSLLPSFAQAYATLCSMSSQIGVIRKAHAAYGDRRLAENAAQVGADLFKLSQSILRIEREVTKSHATPALPSLSYRMPLRPTLNSPPPCRAFSSPTTTGSTARAFASLLPH